MRSMRFSQGCIAALFATLLLTTFTAFAKDGRDFFGYYSVENVVEKGGFVQLTLNLQISNYGDVDVKHAVVMLRENTGLNLVGTTRPIKLLRQRGTASVSQRFTISRTEYNTWHAASQPTALIVYQANGHLWTRGIQLAPR